MYYFNNFDPPSLVKQLFSAHLKLSVKTFGVLLPLCTTMFANVFYLCMLVSKAPTNRET